MVPRGAVETIGLSMEAKPCARQFAFVAAPRGGVRFLGVSFPAVCRQSRIRWQRSPDNAGCGLSERGHFPVFVQRAAEAPPCAWSNNNFWGFFTWCQIQDTIMRNAEVADCL